MADSLNRPELDPESAAPWLAFPGNVLDRTPTGLSMETLSRARSYGPPGRETLLAGRQITDKDVEIPTPNGQLTLAVFTPEEQVPNAPGIYWIHGAGLVAGDRYGAGDALDLAQSPGAVVVSPEYRLAPEHPSPAQLDDCVAGLLWFADHADELGVDPTRLILAGGSAGAGLAAAAALRLRDEGGPVISGLILLSPMLDDRMTSVSSQQFTYGVPWTRMSNEFGWHSALGDRVGTDSVSIYEAPGRAQELTGLPPTFIDVGSADLFRDEAVAFASTIWAGGGNAELHVWPGGYHGFEQMAPASALAVKAVAARKQWLDQLLADTKH
ncbi:alpha/beta hydrolase [Catenulispora rubra]|uniref:alpha/beta hydrolase n=1 Tax=Catenulispora rubra TaxID=280293 RepID=UPI0018922683|nr:alpha/beta hydrolase fold domain-containing protein [Catenulispora rubra]